MLGTDRTLGGSHSAGRGWGDGRVSMHGISQLALLVLTLGWSAKILEVGELKIIRPPKTGKTEMRKRQVTFLEAT